MSYKSIDSSTKYEVSGKVFTDMINHIKTSDNFIVDQSYENRSNLSEENEVFINNSTSEFDLFKLVKCINNFHYINKKISSNDTSVQHTFGSDQIWSYEISLKEYDTDSCKFMPNRFSVTQISEDNSTNLVGMHVFLCRTNSAFDTFYSKKENNQIKFYNKNYISSSSNPFISGTNPPTSKDADDRKLIVPNFGSSSTGSGAYIIEITGYMIPWDLNIQ